MRSRHWAHIRPKLFYHTFHSSCKPCATTQWAMWPSSLNQYRSGRKLLAINWFGTCKPICLWTRRRSTKIVSSHFLPQNTMIFHMFYYDFFDSWCLLNIFSHSLWSSRDTWSKYYLLIFWSGQAILRAWIRLFWQNHGGFGRDSVIC